MKIDEAMIIALKIINESSERNAKTNVPNTFGIETGAFNRLCNEKGVQPSDTIINYLFRNKLIMTVYEGDPNRGTEQVVALTPEGSLFLIQVKNLNVAKNSFGIALTALIISFMTLIFTVWTTNTHGNDDNKSLFAKKIDSTSTKSKINEGYIFCGKVIKSNSSIHILLTFNIENATLLDDSINKATLDSLVSFLKRYPKIKMEIDIHAPRKDQGVHAISISQARAKTVVDTLIKLGADSDRLIPKGWGASEPLPGYGPKDIAKMKTQKEKDAADRINRWAEFRIIEN